MPFTIGHKINLGTKHSLATKEKIRLKKIGRQLSPEHKLKLSLAKKGKVSPVLGMTWKIKDTSKMKGRIPENKGTAFIRVNCLKCEGLFPAKKTDVKRNGGKFCSISCRGKFYSKEKAFAWKGGITTKNEKQRKSKKYKAWREFVFKRDRYTCQLCGRVGRGELNADHIKPWALFPKLRFNKTNGRTLCKPCHRQTPTYGGKLFNKTQ